MRRRSYVTQPRGGLGNSSFASYSYGKRVADSDPDNSQPEFNLHSLIQPSPGRSTVH